MHPLLFELSFGSWGVLPVPAYGASLAAAFGTALVLCSRLAERAGLERNTALGACLVASLAGLLAARAGFVALHPSEVASFGEAISLANGGLSGSIGIAAGAGTLALDARRRRRSPWPLMDAAAPGLLLGVALGRIGCFLEGCDFGKPLGAHASELLVHLGTFPKGSPAWVQEVVAGRLSPTAAFTLPVHPSELYEAAAALALMPTLSALHTRQRRAGTTALFALVAVAAVRVLVDFTRPPSPDAWCARVLLAFALVATALLRWPRARARLP